MTNAADPSLISAGVAQAVGPDHRATGRLTGLPDLMTVQAGAYWARVSPQTVRRWCDLYAIGRKVGGRFLVSRNSLEAFMRATPDHGQIKKERQKQQMQQTAICADGDAPYHPREIMDEGMTMLSKDTLPPRREPNIETVSASLPYGARERIRAAAAAERLTAGEFLRRTILQAVAPDLLQGSH